MLKRKKEKEGEGHHKEIRGTDINILELLMLAYDRAYLSVDLEKSICAIMKCNTVTWDSLLNRAC